MRKFNPQQAGLTSETINQNTALVAFGDSITAGVGLTDMNTLWVKQFADAKGWSLTNYAVSGMKVGDGPVIDNVYAQVVDKTKNYSMMIGVNNAQANGASMAFLDTYRGCLMAAAAWLTLADEYKIRAATLSKTGTWAANGTISNSMDQKSTTNGSTLTGTVQGSTVYVAHIKSPDTGTFTVTIDGVNYGEFATSGSVNVRYTSDGQYQAYLLRFPGLQPGAHTVVITVTSTTNIANAVYIDWIGGNGVREDIEGPNLYLSTLTRSTDAYYASHSPFTDASIALYNGVITEVATSLANDGLGVITVDASSTINRTSDMANDGIHPNDGAGAKIAAGFIALSSTLLKSRDRALSQRLNTPWFDFSLLNGWADFGQEFPKPGYMKDAMGFVHLRGIVKNGTISGSVPVATLPVGFRPLRRVHTSTASNNAFGIVEISALTGNIFASTGNTAYVDLDTITFHVG